VAVCQDGRRTAGFFLKAGGEKGPINNLMAAMRTSWCRGSDGAEAANGPA